MPEYAEQLRELEELSDKELLAILDAEERRGVDADVTKLLAIRDVLAWRKAQSRSQQILVETARRTFMGLSANA